VPPPAQIQITPLIDVLLVLLVLGALAWLNGRAAHPMGRAQAKQPDLLQSLPVTLPTAATPVQREEVVLTEQSALIGLRAGGQLSWQGRPVSTDILERQLQQALALDPQTPVWLAIDAATPYADVARWLDWLQARQVRQLSLLVSAPTQAARAAALPRKP
jgi:biopolymer transport protein ExbD